jgi:hypothetical protein
MSSTRITHHVHNSQLKPSISQVGENTHNPTRIFNLSFDRSEVSFFINDEEDFHIFINKLKAICDKHLSVSTLPLGGFDLDDKLS